MSHVNLLLHVVPVNALQGQWVAACTAAAPDEGPGPPTCHLCVVQVNALREQLSAAQPGAALGEDASLQLRLELERLTVTHQQVLEEAREEAHQRVSRLPMVCCKTSLRRLTGRCAPSPSCGKEVQLILCGVSTAPVLQDLLEADFQKLQEDHKKLGDAAEIAAEATEAALTNEARSSGSGQ